MATAGDAAAPAKVWACVICYRVTRAAVEPLVRALRPQVERLVLIDNAPDSRSDLPELADGHTLYQPMSANHGTAGAMNLAWELAIAAGADYLISFDQDSQPGSDIVASLLACFTGADPQDPPLAAVGPAWSDARTGQRMRILLPVHGRRRHAASVPGALVDVDHVITSGCLISTRAWQAVGVNNEALFLDYVDIEWCLRARAGGWRVAIATGCTMTHAIGDKVVTLGRRTLALHAPMRNYLLLRNHLLLWRVPAIARSWLLSDLVQVTMKLCATLLLAPPRTSRLRWIGRALRDGLRGRGGPPPV